MKWQKFYDVFQDETETDESKSSIIWSFGSFRLSCWNIESVNCLNIWQFPLSLSHTFRLCVLSNVSLMRNYLIKSYLNCSFRIHVTSLFLSSYSHLEILEPSRKKICFLLSSLRLRFHLGANRRPHKFSWRSFSFPREC